MKSLKQMKKWEVAHFIQEEFEANEEMARLECDHSYHVYCIKQWLTQKNMCPICKTAVTMT
jgi:hypothetical protein